MQKCHGITARKVEIGLKHYKNWVEKRKEKIGFFWRFAKILNPINHLQEIFQKKLFFLAMFDLKFLEWNNNMILNYRITTDFLFKIIFKNQQNGHKIWLD